MDNIFENIREALPLVDVVKFYGLDVNRSGMACCPFHEDKTPSLKIYPDHYYCFGCGETGDQTGFVAKLFDIKQYEAAKKISYDFGLGLPDGKIAVPVNERLLQQQQYKSWLTSAGQTVSEYLALLAKWREQLAPKSAAERQNPLFVESLTKSGYVQYLSDVLRFGTDMDKKELYDNCQDEIAKIRERLDTVAFVQSKVKRKAI